MKSSDDERSLEDLAHENRILRSQVDELREANEKFEAEITDLRKKLNEANSYLDQVDVEAEQQYTELTGEIDELCTLVQKKDADVSELKTEITQQKAENKKILEQLEAHRATVGRQIKIIETLNDELDDSNAKSASLEKDKEKLNSQVEEIRADFDTTQKSIWAKEVLLNIELESLKRELEKQKDILDGTSTAAIINKWEQRVIQLEQEISRRDVIIHSQQSTINRLQSLSSPSLSRYSGTNSAESFHRDLDDSRKGTILSFLMGDRHRQLANIYAFSKALGLTASEEHKLERYLADKTYT